MKCPWHYTLTARNEDSLKLNSSPPSSHFFSDISFTKGSQRPLQIIRVVNKANLQYIKKDNLDSRHAIAISILIFFKAFAYRSAWNEPIEMIYNKFFPNETCSYKQNIARILGHIVGKSLSWTHNLASHRHYISSSKDNSLTRQLLFKIT
jgi:hypothetical protein